VAEAIGLVVLLPLLGFLAIALLGQMISERGAAVLACAAVGLAFLAALLALAGSRDLLHSNVWQYTWIQAGNWKVSFGLYADPLSTFMALIVTGVGFLIHVYSVGYMTDAHGKPEHDYRRFFAYMNLFVFTMLLLVCSNNLLFLLVGWGGVGLSSFLLIGFYKDKPSAVAAARKALVTNTIGDVALLLGIFVIIINSPQSDPLNLANIGAVTGSSRDLAAILLIIAAVAKSAQLPLHAWLPDAMEGPTPVSALIHAATMVTAGVYLITRCHNLFAYSDVALVLIPVIGAASAFFAATCALVQTDIKRVLAYSTMSQLGYMFMAAGVGAYEAAMFHLLTHAFFKALLFLTAGSVIHSLDGEQDMRKMGGLAKKIPMTRNLFLVGALAISGIPPLSGFFSKEAILGTFPLFGADNLPNWSLGNASFVILGWVGIIVAFMTALYMFRAFFLVFYGPQNNLQPHKTVNVMQIPLYILAGLSIVGGFLFVPGLYNLLENYFEPIRTPFLDGQPQHWISIQTGGVEWINLIAAVGFAALGIFVAFGIYGTRTSQIPVRAYRGFQAFLLNGWYLDKMYDLLIVSPVRWLAHLLTKEADKDVAEALDWGFGGSVWFGSKLLRKTETGYVRNYALGILVGAVAILLYVTVVAIQR